MVSLYKVPHKTFMKSSVLHLSARACRAHRAAGPAESLHWERLASVEALLQNTVDWNWNKKKQNKTNETRTA